jgi:glyoxylase I family protein
MLKATGRKIELLEYHVPPTATGPISSRAISGSARCFHRGRLDAVLEKVAASGCTAAGKPQTLRTGPNTGKRVVYVRDPDGTTIELMQLPSPAPTELLEIATR